MEYYRLALYIFFGILPSLIWLFYYLKRDLNPEPKKMILKIFFYGALSTIPVFILQIGLSELLNYIRSLGIIDGSYIMVNILKWFVVIAFTEELLKYAVVRLVILKSPELDEPLDIMLYMVIAALGFAALENIFYLFSPIDNNPLDVILKTTIAISFIRFVGATLLHTLSSALLGYFLALASVRARKQISYTIIGILSATLLHGLYNFSIITLKSPMNFMIPIMVITGMAIFIFYDFNEIKKVKGICKL